MNYYTREVCVMWATVTVLELMCMVSCHEWLFHRLFGVLGIVDVVFWLGCAGYFMFTADPFGDREKEKEVTE